MGVSILNNTFFRKGVQHTGHRLPPVQQKTKLFEKLNTADIPLIRCTILFLGWVCHEAVHAVRIIGGIAQCGVTALPWIKKLNIRSDPSSPLEDLQTFQANLCITKLLLETTHVLTLPSCIVKEYYRNTVLRITLI